MGTIAGRVIAPRRRFRIVDRVFHGWQVHHPEEAVSDHRPRVSKSACIIGRRLLARGVGFVPLLACIAVRVYHRVNICDPRKRFRIIARAYHSSRVCIIR